MKADPPVYLNGQFVAAADAKVSIFDRSFCYGDGLFETLLVKHGRVFRWDQHLARFQAGAAFLRIPLATDGLAAVAAELIRRGESADALLRIQLSRGVGRRGYSCRGAESPQLSMTLHEPPLVNPGTPAAWRLITSSLRVAAGDSLTLHKTCNKLLQVLARTEAEAHEVEEALLLNTAGELVEGSGSNLFWMEEGTVRTPPTSAALPGITRAVVLELCHGLGIAVQPGPGFPTALGAAEGVFLTLGSYGVVEATALDGRQLRRSPITGRLHRAYQELLERECGESRATN